MSRRQIVASVVFAALLTISVFAHSTSASANYLVDVWTSENGLPDSSVTAIAQTPDGYLWVGTYNGLARFDGVRFVVFDPGNTPALMHARVRKLFVDPSGTLWINTYDGSLTTCRDGVFKLERQNFRSSQAELRLVKSTADEIVFITSRGDLLRRSPATTNGWLELMPPRRGPGTLCCADGTGTLWYCDNARSLWRVRDAQFESVNTGEVGQINCLATDAAGRMWVGTDNGVAFWDGKKFQSATPDSRDGSTVTFLSVAGNDHAWAIADGMLKQLSERRWITRSGSVSNMFDGNMNNFGGQPDTSDGCWLYSYGGGMVHVAADGGVYRLTSEEGFPGSRVNTVIQDREGNWWAGLDAGGLVRIRERRFHTIASGNDLSSQVARSVCQDNDTIWIASLSGLASWNKDTVTNQGTPASGAVFCVCADNRGRLWISAGAEDLFVRESGSFHRVSPLIHGVKAILADKKGRVWAGTTGGLFVNRGGSTDSFESFEGLSRGTVRALAEDAAGDIWVGTGSGGLYRISENGLTSFRATDNQESGAIWSILADADGVIWAGTFRGGLLRFQNGMFTRISRQNGLPDSVICQIVDDGSGNLWIGSHQGIFRVSKSALNDLSDGKSKFVQCTTYGRADGLPSLECSGGYQPAAFRDRDGRLWFTTFKGAVWVMPGKVTPNLIQPPVVIEEVFIDGRLQTNSIQGIGQRGIPPLKVPPGRHQFEFHYAGLSLVSPENVQFRYKLENADADWVEAGTRRSAQYGFLPPGDYKFQVMACNSDGVWNNTGAAFEMEVLPHFYDTLWFKIVAFFMVVGSVAGTVKYVVTRRLHQKMEQLKRQQAVERERTRIAKDLHDDLGGSLTLIAVLGDLARSEKAGERLEKMSGTAREAVKALDEIVWAVNPGNDTFGHLVDYVGQFATDYLRAAGVRCRLDVPDEVPACEVPATVRHNLFLVVKEALQNVIKHSKATEVWLRILLADGVLRVVIEDNGVGFDRPTAAAWADGLGNMRNRLSEIGGDCDIQSRAGTGTVVTVRLPWPPC